MTGAPHAARLLSDVSAALQDVNTSNHESSMEPCADRRMVPVLLEQLPGIVWITNLEQRVTRACGNCLNFLTQGAPFVPGMTLQEFFGTQDPEFPPIRAHRLAKGGYAAPFEFARERHFLGLTEPIFDAAGNAIGTISLAQDQTDYRITQQNQRVQFLRNLTNGLAGHFNNWLTNVISHTAVAMAQLPAKSQARKTLEQIETASRNMAQLVEEMMSYTPARRIHSEPLHLARLIDEAKPQLAMLAPSGTEINIDAAKELPLVLGDHGLIKSLIYKLVCAVSELMDANSAIRIRAQAVHVNHNMVLGPFHKDEVPEGDYVWLQISCKCSEISESIRLTLFEPFSSGRFSGQGLGLAAAKGIVSLHHGALAAAVPPGGLSFHVLLPASPRPLDIKALEKTEEVALPEK